uniref:Chitin-binding type-2 domain-containing protein n=1 Tax=Heterorhabditis bacteriophora TaxID=37862 RepID=A0A1I7WMH3_HETBA
MAVHRILALACFTVAALADSKSGDETPQYWRAILGDICQLPSFPRATGDPNRYVECVRQSSFAADRKDLGIWLLRECLPGYEFVASARRCKTIRSVKRQQQLCDSTNSSSYQFCPNQLNTQFLVEEIREAPRQCTCPNGENNCVCPSPEILAPVNLPINSAKVRRAPQSEQRIQFSQYQSCPCPSTQPSCTCVTTNNQNEQVLASTQCCQPQSTPAVNPCQCQQSQQQNCQTTTTQQQYCPQQQTTTVVQPQACPLVQGGVQNAQYQGICSWMVDPLAVDPQSRTHYLQCQPAPNNLFCGRWQRMPCAPATAFDVQTQVCVWNTQGIPGTLPTPAPYVSTQAPFNSQCGCTGGVQIGSCNQNYQCPGQSVCQVGQNSGQQCMVCCYFRKKTHRV